MECFISRKLLLSHNPLTISVSLHLSSLCVYNLKLASIVILTVRAGETAQQIKGLLCDREDPSLDPQPLT